MGTCCSVPSIDEAQSAQQFRQADVNKNNLVDGPEMQNYVRSRPEMWAMLSVNLALSEDVCQTTAAQVAMELGNGNQGRAAFQAGLTEAQFHAFRCKYMVDGKGAQEFFHRCVFASFVKDGKQHLEADAELDTFLEIFYKTGSIFQGDTRLPSKDDLKARILNNNSSGKLTFDQIRDVIRGTTGNVSSAPALKRPSSPTAKRRSFRSLQDRESLPEQTPEPSKQLDPPSIELSERHDPEHTPEVQTPEVQPVPPLSPKQPKPRQRKSKLDPATVGGGNRTISQRKLDRAASRSPSQRKMRTASRSRSPSQRKARTKSRSRSPSQRKIRTKTPDGSSSADPNRRPKQPQDSPSTANYIAPPTRRPIPSAAAQTEKSKRQ